ncbi:hypothetical protein KY342_00530 [Candidatus Woesearchaeota archaeon]|nr:hypothetical protein [Candidatus Woesearchaeota archaeon]
MADAFDKHIETQYLNKPYFVQLKRVWRMAKKIPNPEKSKKIGFYLQQARKLKGSAQTNEKIIKDIFGKSQEKTPTKFIEGVFSHAIPEGEKLYVKPETAYQTTQRLMPEKGEKLNKTIQVSVFGDIYDKILDKYKGRKDADDLFRAVNRYLSSHFANAAGFVRWTEVSPFWVHIDAFQTDFFNQLKSMAYHEKENPEIQKIVEEFRKHEDEFFKTAVSYIVRTNPSAKMFTASTPEIVSAVENISERSVPKLNKYYVQIPKKLGFELITLERLRKILRTRPGKKAEALINKFEGAVSKATGKGMAQEATPAVIHRTNANLAQDIAEVMEKRETFLVPDKIDNIIIRRVHDNRIASAYHQHINALSDITKKFLKEKEASKIEKEIKEYLDKRDAEILNTINKKRGGAGNVWWSDRTMIFESTRYENRMIAEQIKKLAGV